MRIFKYSLILILLVGSNLFTQGLITGSTTWGEKLVIPVDSNQVRLNDIVGNKKIKMGAITLNGKNNSIKIDLSVIETELNLSDESGNLQADLKLFKIILASEGAQTRHWIGIKGNIGDQSISIELDFEPGMSAITGSTARSVSETPFSLRMINNSTGVEKKISGTSSKVGWWLW